MQIADGSSKSISEKETIHCTPNMKLSSVLHVPRFLTNLLSISSITKDLNCKAIFFPNHCIFQELTTRATIGHAEMHNKLYYLTEGTSQNCQHVGLTSSDNTILVLML